MSEDIENPVQSPGAMNPDLESIFREFGEKYVEILNKTSDQDELDSKIAELTSEIEKKLKAFDLNVEFFVDIDNRHYFNAPGYPRAYNYYEVFVDNRVVDRKNKKVYYVTVIYSELQKPETTEYVFDRIDITEYNAIDDDTPFARTLDENVPWMYIREMWKSHIIDYISEIAIAEREKKLEEKLKEIKEQAEKGAWIYDYQHFYNALMKTAQQFNISL
jgi:hypothetical protein